MILNAVEKLIPDDLKVVYQHGNFDGHGFYEPKSNTITIKSKESEGSKVDKHLIIHELLHSALATRIQAIKEGKANKEAIAAYNKLEALRKEILGKIGHLPKDEQNTLKGMLENVDEFISYGLTDQRLQEILQGIRAERQGGTASSIKDRFRTFSMAVGKLLGFPKSTDLDALTAFARDTAALIKQVEKVTPSQTHQWKYFSQSFETEKAYEDRIDALFRDRSLARRSGQGVRMLDSSDLLDLLGFGGYVVQLDEQHIAHSGFDKHPEITQQDYKDLPKWLDDPIAVLPSEKHDGKLVFITDQIRNGMQVIVAIAPLTDNTDKEMSFAKRSIAVTVYGMEESSLKGLLKYNEAVYLNDNPSSYLKSVGSPFVHTQSHAEGGLVKKGNQTSIQGIPVQKSKDILNQDDLTRYRENQFNAKTKDSPAWFRDQTKKKLEHTVVGKELRTIDKYVQGEVTPLGVRDSLSDTGLKRTQDRGIKPLNHVLAMSRIEQLWQQAIEVSPTRSTKTRHFESVFKSPNGSNYVAHILWKNGAVELVKLVPLNENTQQGELSAEQSKLRQITTTPNPQTKFNSQYSFDDGVQFAQEVITELSAHDELFKYPKSSKATLQGIFSDVVGGAIQYKGEVTAADERQESTADHKYLYRFKGKDVYMYTRDNGEIWINVSKLEEGLGGSAILAAFGNYAYNTKKVWIGDPKGMTEAGMTRLLSTQLSLALKFETTQFIQPSPEQQRGDTSKGIAALKWGNNEVENLRNLIQAFVGTTYHQLKGLDNYYYDFKQQGFFDRMGRPVRADRFRDGASKGLSRAARAGESTIKRAIVLKSLISSQSSERPRILEQFLHRYSPLEERGLKGIFYSQNSFNTVSDGQETDSTTSGTGIDGEAQQSNRGLDQKNTTKAEQTKPTPLQQWFEDRKGQDISKKDLLKHLHDNDLTEQERVILNAVEKLIPDDLKVVYQHGNFDGHGFYEPKSNTITIKSKGSEGSKVDKHLVIHELLHSALATRIQAVKEGKANKEAVAAYNKLEALRKEILGKIGHLSKDEQNTLKGMLENVDEFISYGLTNQKVQDILEGISVTRNDRTAPTVRNKLKVFFELVSRVIGFAKSEQVNALIAFAKDTTDLLNAIQPVKPSQTDATYFQQSPETGKAYERRIDALFKNRNLAQDQGKGIRMLDSSDLLDLLGFGGYEVQLDEHHVAHSGFDKHPEITQQDYKDLPHWLDEPIAVFTDKNHEGKLVFITDQVRDDKQVLVAVDPLVDRSAKQGTIPKKHIAVTVYGIETENLKGLLRNNKAIYLKEDAPDTLFQSDSQSKHNHSRDSGVSAQRALPFDTLRGRVQKAEGMLNQDDLTRYRNSLDRAKVEKSPAWWRAEVKKQHEDKLVGRELHTVEKHIAGTLTTLGLRDSLSQQAIKRTQDQGIHPMHHVFAVRNLKKLWEQSVEVSKNTQGNVRDFESIYKKDQDNFIAHFLLRNGAIELVKLVPLSANTLNGELTNTQSKLRQQATTPNPQTKFNSQYSFDAVQDEHGREGADSTTSDTGIDGEAQQSIRSGKHYKS